MGLFDDEDVAFERKVREDNLLTPSTAPGQDKGGFGNFSFGDDDEDDDDIITPAPPGRGSPFGSPGGGSPFGPPGGGSPFGAPGGGSPFGSPGGGSPFGSPGGSSPFGPPGGGSPFGATGGGSQGQPKDIEDRVLEGLMDAGKHSGNALKTVTDLAKKADAGTWARFGGSATLTGGILAVLMLILTLINSIAFPFALGGLMLTIMGLIALALNYDKSRQVVKELVEFTEPPQEETYDLFGDGDDEEGDFEEELEEEKEAEDLFDMQEDLDDMLATLNQPKDSEQVLQTLDVDRYGMVSRANIVDKILPALEHQNPNFAAKSELSTVSNEFITYAAQIRRLSSVLNLPAGQQLELTRVEQGFVTDILYIERPSNAKQSLVKQFDEELTNVLAYKGGTNLDSSIYTTTLQIGANWITTVTKGAKSMVTLKDVLTVEKDFVSDSSNTLPILLGYSPDGSTLKVDFKDVESILISGMPRSGKTWFVKLIMGQLALFQSPEDVIFYIADVKDTGSDFYDFRSPHVKAFASKTEDIMSMLGYLVTQEAKKRSDILASTNSKNIWDHNKKMPDEPLPVLYVVIDEMVSLMDTLNKDEKQVYLGYLRQLVTKLPSVGVRLIGIPHVLKHAILGKTIVDMASFKASVMGDAEHIQDATGATKKEFPYVLGNKGDVALKGHLFKGDMKTDKAEYCRSFVLASNSDNMDNLFELSRKVWTKFAPHTVAGSRAEEVE